MAKVLGKEKMPAPIIEPMTSADRENRESLFCADAAMLNALPKLYYSWITSTFGSEASLDAEHLSS
jgi:hypothetical protein